MKSLSVGIGCRSRSSAQQIEAAVRQALGSLGALAFEQIRTVASIDSKADEPGLREFCARHGLLLTLFSREQIAAIPVASASAAAREHAGVDGVCEPCALLAAQTLTSTACLVVAKTIHAGVTVAIASSSRGVGEEPTGSIIEKTNRTSHED
jgi:cobalamin biosynthesis protein CbiG